MNETCYGVIHATGQIIEGDFANLCRAHSVPTAAIFGSRSEALRLANQDGAADQRVAERRSAHKHAAQAAAATRRRAIAEHDRLYDAAMRLAADVDDMDCVEHYCQGHIDRLRDFIDARK